MSSVIIFIPFMFKWDRMEKQDSVSIKPRRDVVLNYYFSNELTVLVVSIL
jgi:hypothetical protein